MRHVPLSHIVTSAHASCDVPQVAEGQSGRPLVLKERDTGKKRSGAPAFSFHELLDATTPRIAFSGAPWRGKSPGQEALSTLQFAEVACGRTPVAVTSDPVTPLGWWQFWQLERHRTQLRAWAHGIAASWRSHPEFYSGRLHTPAVWAPFRDCLATACEVQAKKRCPHGR